MLTKGPHGLGKVVPSASRDRERSRRRARSTQAPADAAPDDTSEVGFWTANYAERLRSIAVKYIGIRNQTIPAQLARHGYAPEDIKFVHLTHLHYDHAGGCNLLPNARFVLQRTELMAAAAPMGPEQLAIGGKGLFFDRADVADLVDPLWSRVDLMEGDYEPYPGIRCVLYANSHTPGHQCIYVETADGIVAIIGDIARKLDLNIEKEILPGIYYDLDSMRRALIDIKSRADAILPTHDWNVLEGGKPEGLA